MFRFLIIHQRNMKRKYFKCRRGYGYFLKLKRNNYYYLGYWHIGHLSVIPFVYNSDKKNKYYAGSSKESLNRRLVTLQLQGIKSQLILTLHSILLIQSLPDIPWDRHLAYDYMNKFTQLLRVSLMMPTGSTVALEKNWSL